MTGATFAHEQVVGNISFALRAQLRANGSLCTPFGPDIGLRVSQWMLRPPDIAVYCPPFDEDALTSDRPRLLVEVLSRSTERMDQLVKVEEYKPILSLQTVLLVSPTTAEVGVWRRGAAGWTLGVETDLAAAIAIPDLGLSLPLRDIYDGATLATEPRFRLVWPDAPDA